MPTPSRHADVTIVVTNYNYGRFLEEAVTSALEQEGGAPHVIVVDDGSTDAETLAALDRLPKTVHLHRQQNAGVANARNAGLGLADTPYLMILDADDRLRPGTLTALRAPLDAANHADVGFTYGITHFFGDWEGEMTMPPYDPYKLLYRHTIGATALMRRELVDDTGGYDPAFVGYEDWEFWLHALSRGWQGLRVNAPTLDYRRHGSTKLSADRGEYRQWYRRLQHKYPDLYKDGRLAQASPLSPLGRAVYRWWWGARPLPGRVEHALHRLLWGTAKWRKKRR